ncbi:pol polyprotein [Lasius niger]|uniref:RNA-directed DNA polymerase n=1 Tax=Lasius niger TaxID=67767 RepID=A0A0J7KIR8_LASNI|nr:pol polyprotein [Lasius niger]
MVLGLDFLSHYRATLRCDGEKFGIEFDAIPRIDSVSVNAITVGDAGVELERVLGKYERVFRDEIGRVNNYEHAIRVTSKAPFKSKTYPIADIHRERVKEHLLDLEKADIIERTATPYVNPLVVVVKKTGEIRLCLDAREINKRMENDHDQPPTIDEIFRRVGSRKFFSTLDVAKAFWQIPLREQDRRYTGFKFDNQTYVFKRLPFGLKTAGSSFTRAIVKTLGDDCDGFAIIYLDDILIASDTMEEHLRHLSIILKRLDRAGFRLNRAKCEFLKSEISFLGHTFDEVRVEMNNDTKLAIQNFPRPRNKKAIQSFLGLVNWDRRFVRNLAELNKPLENLLKKDEKFVWRDEQQRAFVDIKNAFRDATSLFIIRSDYKFGIYVDASKSGLGARLYQYRDAASNEQFTVAYASRSLRGAEFNYTITELECLSLVWALRKWHVMLLGRHVRVHTDHRALEFLTSCADDSSRIARWLSFLREFDLEIRHIPGRENVTADALSRNNIRYGFDRKPVMTRTMAAIGRPEDEVETVRWVEMIVEAQSDNEDIQALSVNDPQRYAMRDGMIRVRVETGDRILVPDEIRWNLIRRIHKYLLHFGTDKVVDFAERFFAVNNLERIVRDVVASCHECIATKYYTRPTRGIEYYELPDAPNKIIAVDIFGPLPQTPRGYKYILVTMDQFSKLTRLFVMKNQKLETITRTLDARYFDNTPVPSEILSDNGGQFITDRWSEYANERGFSNRKTSPYNPQSNPVERVMRELGRIIRLYAHDNQSTWDRVIERAEKTINSTAHRSTGFSPYDLHPERREEELSCDPRLRSTERDHAGVNPEVEYRERLQMAARTLQRRASQRKTQSDRHGEAARYEVGSSVWVKLHRRSDASRRLTRKIHLVYDGPYTILREIRRNAYLIGDSDGNALGTYNSRQLRPHREARYGPPGIARIDMLRRADERGATGAREPSATEDAPRKEVMVDDSDSDDGETEAAHKLHNIAVEFPKERVGPRSADEPTGRRTQATKYSPVNEKGLRHIRRIFGVLRGESRVFAAPGHIRDRSVRVLFDMRGDFDVATTAAVRDSSGNKLDLEYINDPQNIPAYLKAQKNVEIQAVNCRVAVRGTAIAIQPMLLRGEDPVVLLSRYSSEKFFLHLTRRSAPKLSRRVRLAKGKQLVQQWMEQRGQRDPLPETRMETLTSHQMRSVAARRSLSQENTPGETREDTIVQKIVSEEEESSIEDQDTDVIADSEQERIRGPVETSVREKVQPSRRAYFTSSQWQELWSSDEEEQRATKIRRTENRKSDTSECSIKAAKDFVKFVSCMRNLPVVDLTREAIERCDSEESETRKSKVTEPREKQGESAKDTVAISPKTDKNIVSEIQSAFFTPPADTGVEGVEMRVGEGETNLSPVSCARMDDETQSQSFVVARNESAGAYGLVESSRVIRELSGKSDASETRSCKNAPGESSVRDLVARDSNLFRCRHPSVCEMSNRSVDDAVSQPGGREGDPGMSLEDILREENQIKDRIRARMEMSTERQKALERVRRLRRIEESLDEAPSEDALRQCRQRAIERSEDLLKFCKSYYEYLQAGRVITDDYQINDENDKPLYSLSTLIWVKNLQSPDEDVRPVVARYHIKGNVVHRYYGDDSEMLLSIPVIDPAEEPLPSTSRQGSVVASTPLAIEKPRVTSCVAGTFIDGTSFVQPGAAEKESETADQSALGHPEFGDFAVGNLLGRYLTPTQTAIIDASSDAFSDVSVSDGAAAGSSCVKRPRPTEAVVGPRVKRVGSKAPRRASKSRQAPLVGEMQPEAASTSTPRGGGGTDRDAEESWTNRRRQTGAEEQLRVVVDRM